MQSWPCAGTSPFVQKISAMPPERCWGILPAIKNVSLVVVTDYPKFCLFSPLTGPRCPKPNGRFRHPGNCHMYIHCVHGILHEKYCPHPLHFNPSKKRCEWSSYYCRRKGCEYNYVLVTKINAPSLKTVSDMITISKFVRPKTYILSKTTQFHIRAF